jgi:hypothetical protein
MEKILPTRVRTSFFVALVAIEIIVPKSEMAN